MSGPASDDACALATCLRKPRAAGSLHPRSALRLLPQAQAEKSTSPPVERPCMPRKRASTLAASGAPPAPRAAWPGLAAGARLPSVRAKNRSRGTAGVASCSRSSSPPSKWALPPPPFLLASPRSRHADRPAGHRRASHRPVQQQRPTHTHTHTHTRHTVYRARRGARPRARQP